MHGEMQIVEPIRRRLIGEEVAERLIAAIASGDYQPGRRLLEQEVAETLGVSRVPVREAIHELALQGILQEAGGRGWCVAPFDDKQIDEIYSVRLAIEGMMLTTALPRFQERPELFEPLDRQIRELRAAADAGDTVALNRADLAFHRAALEVADNRLGLKIWEGLSRQVLIIFGMETYRDPDLPAIVEQHVSLRRTLAEGDAKAVTEELREHITGFRSLVSARKTRTTVDRYNKGGTP